MTLPVLCLFLTKVTIFLVVGLMFFQKGKHTMMWVVTALPFMLNGALLVFHYVRGTHFTPGSETRQQLIAAVATVLCAAAIALYAFTLGTHRVSIPMWHQPQDRPSQLVTWGAYRFMRHRFYASYILFFAASILLIPAWPTFLNALCFLWLINFTAAKEEKELAAKFGNEYAQCSAVTGRFWPWARR
jgi:protein-S-isoprenylcysteine O-methyltransferase Ste14